MGEHGTLFFGISETALQTYLDVSFQPEASSNSFATEKKFLEVLKGIPLVELSDREAVVIAAAVKHDKKGLYDWAEFKFWAYGTISTICRKRKLNSMTENKKNNSFAEGNKIEDLRVHDLTLMCGRLLQLLSLKVDDVDKSLHLLLPGEDTAQRTTQKNALIDHNRSSGAISPQSGGGRTLETTMGPAPGYDGGESLTILKRSLMVPVRSLKAPVFKGLRKSKMNNMEASVVANASKSKYGLGVSRQKSLSVLGNSREVSRENSRRIETDNDESFTPPFTPLSTRSSDDDHRKGGGGYNSFEPVLKPLEPIVPVKSVASFLSIKVLEDLDNSNMFTNRDLVAFVMAVDSSFSLSIHLPVKLPTIALIDLEAAEEFLNNIVPGLYLEVPHNWGGISAPILRISLEERTEQNKLNT
eukprot:CAMPEP_0119039658 /NCGR_PEP_ID=MMETSP1177-20130426/9282_1 /TAXON_ID=2985 /ORGANISM="Ochromonas sp, Strain CCMP1899" /LENGTH=413 /DNA_ID=CAMNT_0007003831 /DNA_START=69 /DNA_END=1310 /DNA_ORIENTATION=-